MTEVIVRTSLLKMVNDELRRAERGMHAQKVFAAEARPFLDAMDPNQLMIHPADGMFVIIKDEAGLTSHVNGTPVEIPKPSEGFWTTVILPSWDPPFPG